jgi:hypothetical protein
MKTLLLSLAMLSMVVLAWQFGPSYAAGQQPAPGAPPPIDFARLHSEARDALERLREKQITRLSMNERKVHPAYSLR